MTNTSIAGIKKYPPGIVSMNLVGVNGQNLVDGDLEIGVFGVGFYAGVYGISDKINSVMATGVFGLALGIKTGINVGVFAWADNATVASSNYAH